MSQRSTIAVLGAGSIGVSFAVLFSDSGATVRLWDPVLESRERAELELRSRLEMLSERGMLSAPVGDVLARVSICEDLGTAVTGADLVQECAPERVDVKRQLFDDIAAVVGDRTVLASSSSAIVPSVIGAGLAIADRLIVGHPGNPPYLLPVIEVVPSPATRPDIVDRAMTEYRSAGLAPVLVRQEVEGFLFNRLQGAVMREAYCLVRDGVASVADIDTVMREGLGRRWAFIGPFETVDLNTRGGIASHAEKMGPAYARMGAERGQNDPWTPELVSEVVAQRRAQLPLAEWEDRVAWRDEQLMRLMQLRAEAE